MNEIWKEPNNTFNLFRENPGKLADLKSKK